MNISIACELLDINPYNIDPGKIKKQYYLKALKYHPDKYKEPDASTKFNEIKEAYDFLQNNKNTKDPIIESPHLTSYESIIRFFTGTLDNNLKEEYTHILLEKVLTICEKQALQILEKVEDRKFFTAYKIITKYKNVFHLSPCFFEEMERNKLYRFVQGNMKKQRLYDIVKADLNLCDDLSNYEIHVPDEPVIPEYPPIKEEIKEDIYSYKVYDPEWDLEIEMNTPYEITKEYNRQIETMILRPTLDDLWENNLYKYTRDKTYLIPLWHHEIVYELNEEMDFVVQMKPKMPSNTIWIDEDNNIHQKQEYSLYELWGFSSKEQCMFVHYGKKKFAFYPHELHIKRYQRFVWESQGISRINESHTFDVSRKSHVILHIYLM